MTNPVHQVKNSRWDEPSTVNNVDQEHAFFTDAELRGENSAKGKDLLAVGDVINAVTCISIPSQWCTDMGGVSGL